MAWNRQGQQHQQASLFWLLHAQTLNMGREKGHPNRQTDRQTDRQATIAIKQEQMGMSFLNTETPAG